MECTDVAVRQVRYGETVHIKIPAAEGCSESNQCIYQVSLMVERISMVAHARHVCSIHVGVCCLMGGVVNLRRVV